MPLGRWSRLARISSISATARAGFWRQPVWQGGGQRRAELCACLEREVADAEALVEGLLRRAEQGGKAQEVLPRRDGRLELHVIRLTEGYFQWQIERELVVADRESTGVPRLPMLTVSAKGAICS